MSTIEIKIAEYNEEIRLAHNEVKEIKGMGIYAGLSDEKKIEFILSKEAIILSNEALILSNKKLMNTLLQQKSGKNNCNLVLHMVALCGYLFS